MAGGKSNISVDPDAIKRAGGIKAWIEVWADRINAGWQEGVDAILKTADSLVEAKKQLNKAEFADLIEHKLRFSANTARRLIMVASDNRLRAHAHRLPASWTTLYELTKLPDEDLEQALRSGEISAKTQRSDVQQLRRPAVTEAEYHEIPERSEIDPTASLVEQSYAGPSEPVEGRPGGRSGEEMPPTPPPPVTTERKPIPSARETRIDFVTRWIQEAGEEAVNDIRDILERFGFTFIRV